MNLWKELAFALRTSRRHWGASLVMFVSLALGILLTSVAFSVVNSILLQPLANYREPDRLVMLWGVQGAADTGLFSLADFSDYMEKTRTFESLAAFDSRSFTFIGGDRPGYLRGMRVSPQYFAATGLEPVLGRGFSSTDQQVVVLSHETWERQFDRDPDVLSKKLELDDEAHQVIGILPPHVGFLPSRLWIPLPAGSRSMKFRNARNLYLLGRLKPGVSINQAEDDLKAAAEWLQKTYPRTNQGLSVRVVRLRDQLVGDYSGTLLLAQGATLFILLLACANVVKILLARSRRRRQEMAVRCALGAGQLRMLRQNLVEVAVVALPAVALAIAATQFALATLPLWIPVQLPRQSEIEANWLVALFSVSIALLISFIAGLVPSWDVRRADLAQCLKAAAGSLKPSRFGDLLVQLEVAVSVVLLVGVALLVQSFFRIQSLPLGYNPNGIIAVRIEPEGARYSEIEAQRTFWRRLIREAQQLPRVSAAAASSDVPMLNEGMLQPVSLDGAPLTEPANPKVRIVTVSPEFFQVMGVSVLKGRAFRNSDHFGAPGVAIVNQSFARRHWLGQDPLNRKVETISRPLSVVGVVQDSLLTSLLKEPQPVLYTCSLQDSLEVANFLILRSEDKEMALESFRSLMHRLDPAQPVGSSLSLESWAFREWAPSRFVMHLLGAFTVASVILAQIGIAGMAADSIVRRRRELGIRMAIGASPTAAVALLTRQSALKVAVGLAVGIVVALGLTRFISHLLYFIQANDFITLAGSFLALLVAGLLASYLPARKAAKMDLADLLRAE